MQNYIERMRELEASGTIDLEEYILLRIVKALVPVITEAMELSDTDVADSVADAGWWDSGSGIEIYTVTLKTGQALEFGPDTETVFAYRNEEHRAKCLEEPDSQSPTFQWSF